MEGLDNILSAITSHFVEVYKSDNVEGNLGWVHSLPELVLPSMNDCLTAPVSDLEIKAAVDGMGATKSPGPDGINGMFFQGYWEIVGHAVCAVVHSFFNEGVLPREINETVVALVPQVPQPECINHLRPISCCNFIYKVISKLIVLRLKPFMGNLVSYNQSAF